MGSMVVKSWRSSAVYTLMRLRTHLQFIQMEGRVGEGDAAPASERHGQRGVATPIIETPSFLLAWSRVNHSLNAQTQLIVVYCF